MKNARAKRSLRRCRHGYLFFLLSLCEVVLSLTRSCCPSENMRTYTSPWAGDVKISDNSVISGKFAIKFTIDISVYLIFPPLFHFLVSFRITRFLFWKMVKKPHCYATVVIFLTCCISLQACADKLQCERVQSVYVKGSRVSRTQCCKYIDLRSVM